MIGYYTFITLTVCNIVIIHSVGRRGFVFIKLYFEVLIKC